jgi:hypothetical protein
MNAALELSPTEIETVLAEEHGRAEADVDFAREGAAIAVFDAAQFYVEGRAREHIRQAENRAGLWFASRPRREQEKILHDAVRALVDLRSTKSFPYRSGVSVRPGDLFSNVHLGDVLHLISQHPRLWRLIALEGVAGGALLFEEWNGFAVVLANPNWQGDFVSCDREEREGEIRACVRVLAEPYPETLPDPSWQAGTRASLERRRRGAILP